MTPEAQLQILSQCADEILPDGQLLERLRVCARDKRPLRVKQGFDPTAPDIHLGHSVGLRKLRQFQDLGHQAVLIVGDYTGLVGDPSGRSKTRPQLTPDQVEANARTYLEQFFKVLDRNPAPPRLPVEIHRNGEWFADWKFMDVMRLGSQYTVARLLERDDFAKRFTAHEPISVHELFYPLMQGYDSVAIRSDVELGGTEQKFNLLVGRVLQEIHGQPPQIALTLPILPGLDGVQRMSKSLGNYIGVADPPREMFGKVMSLPDGIMSLYWSLVTDATSDELHEIEASLADPGTNPMSIKKALGLRIVRMFHGSEAAASAQRDFEAQFSRREVPERLPEFGRASLLAARGQDQTPSILDALVASGFAASRGAARRLVEQGAVTLDGERVGTIETRVEMDRPWVLRAGRKMARFVPGSA